MKYEKHWAGLSFFLLWASLSPAQHQPKRGAQRVKIDRVLGVKGGQIQQGGFVAQIRGAFLKTIIS